MLGHRATWLGYVPGKTAAFCRHQPLSRPYHQLHLRAPIPVVYSSTHGQSWNGIHHWWSSISLPNSKLYQTIQRTKRVFGTYRNRRAPLSFSFAEAGSIVFWRAPSLFFSFSLFSSPSSPLFSFSQSLSLSEQQFGFINYNNFAPMK